MDIYEQVADHFNQNYVSETVGYPIQPDDVRLLIEENDGFWLDEDEIRIVIRIFDEFNS